MLIQVFKSKIHRAVVTDSNLNYNGSITIDSKLLKEADIIPGEKVQVINNNNGERFETYTIEGDPNSGTICVNGGGARLVQPGDVLIIISYGIIDKEESKQFEPKIVILNDENRIVK